MTTVSELIQQLKEFQKIHGDREVYTAIDEEGNGYNELIYHPTAMYREGGERYRPDMVSYEDLEDEDNGLSVDDYVKVCVL